MFDLKNPKFKYVILFVTALLMFYYIHLVYSYLWGVSQASKERAAKNSIVGLTYQEAEQIAEATCIKGAESLTEGIYNVGTRTWWFDANLNATRAGCNPACVVSEETKTAEINWRCTGLLNENNNSNEQVFCTMELKECPDGSYVGRSGPNCAFAPCP